MKDVSVSAVAGRVVQVTATSGSGARNQGRPRTNGGNRTVVTKPPVYLTQASTPFSTSATHSTLPHFGHHSVYAMTSPALVEGAQMHLYLVN